MNVARIPSRERLLAAIKCQRTDHIPFSPYIGQGPEWKGPLRWQDQFQRAERMLELGLDPTIDIWLPDVQPHRDVQIKTWREHRGPDVLMMKQCHARAGTLCQEVRETHDCWSPEHGPWIPTTFGVEKRDHFGDEVGSRGRKTALLPAASGSLVSCRVGGQDAEAAVA